MESAAYTDTEEPLPLASLRLLVSPLQLLSASMWQIIKKKDVMNFGKVSEFVSFLMSTVPELLLFKHWVQLILGLRARFILELCRKGEDKKMILSHLENMTVQQSALHREFSDEKKVAEDFTKKICAHLKDNREREIILQEVWCEEFGPHFDADLQTLFLEVLCRLNQLLPAPDLEQTVLWLGGSLVMEDFLQCISANFKNLLLHHKQLGHLDQHVPPSSMGEHILSSLSAALPNRPSNLQRDLETQTAPMSEDLQSSSFIEESAMEIFTEIELTTTQVQIVVIENATPHQSVGEAHEDAVKDVTENVLIEDKNSTAILNDQSLNVTSAIEVLLLDDTTPNDTDGKETVIALKENEEDGEAMKNNFALVLTASAGNELAFRGNRTAKGDETVITLKQKNMKGMEDNEKMMENDVLTVLKEESQVTSPKRTPSGSHDCPDCGKKFKFASFLLAHRVIHTGERPHKCFQCGQCFSFRQSLERHKHTHKTLQISECPSCSKSFSSSEARAVHAKTHSDIHQEMTEINSEQGTMNNKENIDDKVCEPAEEQSLKDNGDSKTQANQAIDAQLMNKVISLVQVRTSQRKNKTTKKMRSLQKKLEQQKEAEKRRNGAKKTKSSDHSYGTTTSSSKHVHKGVPHSCPHCDYCHSEEAEIQQHINKSHCSDPHTQQTSNTTAEDGEGENPGCNFKCSVCQQSFQSPQDRKDHMASAHMRNGVFYCSRCGKDYTWKAAFVRHVRMYCSEGRTGSFACPHCELAFDRSSALYSHIQTHHEERSHSCNCGKSFVSKAALTAHQRTHQRERPHVCLQCRKGFLYKGGLLAHMKIHSQEMPFACSHCGKAFKRERNMKKHQRCHTREDVFKCSQCDKSFVYKATLTRHELTHTGERPFLCSDCGKGFFSHAELLKHERFHTGHKPFECPHCGKRFTQSCYLTIHLRYHTGAKPYACGDCEKSFLSANRLKRHQRTHTGEKPYVCGECGNGFRQSYHLKLHQRRHVIDLT